MSNLDRFTHGKSDPQETTVFAECDGCGNEIYMGEAYYEFEGPFNNLVVCHKELECLERAVNAEEKTAGEEKYGSFNFS